MSDRIQEEIDVWQKRSDAIKADLEKFVFELSTVAQVVLIMEIARIDAHIKDMTDELEDMKFDGIVSDYYKRDSRDT